MRVEVFGRRGCLVTPPRGWPDGWCRVVCDDGRIIRVWRTYVRQIALERRSEWDRFQHLLNCATVLIDAGDIFLSESVRLLGEGLKCERWAAHVNRLSAQVEVCGSCNRSVVYGINTLLQTGRGAQVLTLLDKLRA